MCEAIGSGIMVELRKFYPNSGFSMVILRGCGRIAMIKLVVRGDHDIIPVTKFMSLTSGGFVFDDGFVVPYDLPDSIELVVAHFGVDK
jgi:hypothetical protein